MEKIPHKLSDVAETLLLTLYARAHESHRADALLKDPKAVQIVQHLAGDLSQYKMRAHDEVAIIMRTRKFDNLARKFLEQDLDGVIVHIGCGLDTRFERVDNHHTDWFDLDLPEVIALRQQLIPTENSRYHTLATSVFDEGWIETVRQYHPRPFLFLAEGVLPYFEEAQVQALFLTLRKNFPGAELVCDGHKPFVLWVDNLQLAFASLKARLKWSIKDGHDPEHWGEGIQLLEEWNYYDEHEPRLKQYQWAQSIPTIANSSGVFHYKLGN